jgi:pimeloyl-ACP methyl ester carboxylesterase
LPIRMRPPSTASPLPAAAGRAGPSPGPLPSAQGRGLRQPESVQSWTCLNRGVAEVGGGKISSASQGAQQRPLLLSRHGWGDNFRVVLPLEYPLIEAGFRLLVVTGPGYAGTALKGEVEGKTMDWRRAAGFARMVAALLDQLYGADQWRLGVGSREVVSP